MRHGKGELLYANGDKYGGLFDHDMEEDSEATLTYCDGDIFRGGYRKGKRHGHGVYTHSNGDRYEGSYQDDERHGKGVIYFATGDVQQGVWEKGVLLEN